MATSWMAVAAMLTTVGFRSENYVATMARRNALNLQVISSPLPPMAAEKPVVAPPMASLAEAPATVAKAISEPVPNSPKAAIERYVSDMVKALGGTGVEFEFAELFADYQRDYAIGKGWPTIASKGFALGLKRHGCTSRVTPRNKAGKRPTVYAFPEKIKNKSRARKPAKTINAKSQRRAKA